MEGQIIGILEQNETGDKGAELAREHGVGRGRSTRGRPGQAR